MGAETAASKDDEAAGLADGREEDEAGGLADGREEDEAGGRFRPEKPCLPLSTEGNERA